MADTVRTAWHKVLELWDQGRINVPNDIEDNDMDLEEAKTMIMAFNEAPHFVVDSSLIQALDGAHDLSKAVLDLAKADKINFPFPVQTVQVSMEVWDNGQCKKAPAFCFLGFVQGQIVAQSLIIDPFRNSLQLGYHSTILEVRDLGPDRVPLDFRAVRSPIYKRNSPIEVKSKQDLKVIWYCPASLVVLVHTKGVAKEEIVCNKLNKARKRSGKREIPKVVYIHVGKVYKKDGTVETYNGERQPQRVHWRRGHDRRVAVGKGRTGREWRYIEPCLVNYVEGDDKPAQPLRVLKW